MDVLKSLRLEKGFTQQKVADYLGISRPAYSRYENGEREPDNDTLKKLAIFFDVTVDHLIGISDQKEYVLKIPVYGVIPGGIPIEAIENIEDYEEAPLSWAKGAREFFALKLKGDSMFPEYRNDDVIILKRQSDCESGEDCAVLINGCDATFKRVEKQPHGIVLKPLNSQYKTQFFTNEDIQSLPVKIIGVFWELRRSRAIG